MSPTKSTQHLYIADSNFLPMSRDESIKKFSGEWILLFNDTIVNHSINLEDVLKMADEKYPADKFPNDDIKISKVLTGNVRL